MAFAHIFILLILLLYCIAPCIPTWLHYVRVFYIPHVIHTRVYICIRFSFRRAAARTCAVAVVIRMTTIIINKGERNFDVFYFRAGAGRGDTTRVGGSDTLFCEPCVIHTHTHHMCASLHAVSIKTPSTPSSAYDTYMIPLRRSRCSIYLPCGKPVRRSSPLYTYKTIFIYDPFFFLVFTFSYNI